MKEIKALLSVFLVITIALGGNGCMNIHSTDRQIKMAEQKLEEKYGEPFCVRAIGERFGTLTNNTYKVVCNPTNNPKLVFIAEIDKQGYYIFDDYVSVCVCNRINSVIQDNLMIDIGLLVVSRPSETEETDPNISIEDFALNNNADFVVYAVTKENFDDIKVNFDIVMKLLNTINLEIRCYDQVTDDQYTKFLELSNTTNQMDSEIKFLLNNLPNVVKYEAGVNIGG